jgi:hypothetical protein
MPPLTRAALRDEDSTLRLALVGQQSGLKAIGFQVADARDVQFLAELFDRDWDREVGFKLKDAGHKRSR